MTPNALTQECNQKTSSWVEFSCLYICSSPKRCWHVELIAQTDLDELQLVGNLRLYSQQQLSASLYQSVREWLLGDKLQPTRATYAITFMLKHGHPEVNSVGQLIFNWHSSLQQVIDSRNKSLQSPGNRRKKIKVLYYIIRYSTCFSAVIFVKVSVYISEKH